MHRGAVAIPMCRETLLTGAQASSLAKPGFRTLLNASGTLALQSSPLRFAGAVSE